MSGQLPDEIIKEILSPVLRVSDETFRSTARISPFFRDEESTSALLVVCKSWLRVSTPLLYHVVVLRSKAQAKALDRAIRANKLLGTFIKKLRVEGGMGASMEHIIKAAPNITELCLTLSLWTSDGVSGLCRGLPTMNPQCVILCDPPDAITENAHTRQLVEVLCKCIGGSWKALASVELPYNSFRVRYLYHRSSRVSDIANALVTAPRLTTLILKHPQYSRDFLARVAQNPLLQLVRVVFLPTDHGLNDGPTLKKSRQFENSLDQDDRLKKLLSYEYPAPEADSLPDGDGAELFDDSSPSFSASFMAFQTTPEEIKHMIWSNIIYFTLLRDPRLDNASIYDSFNHIGPEHINKVWRVNILLVCKLFRKMARQHFYRCRILAPHLGLGLLADRVQNDPSLGSHLRSLITQSHISNPEHFRTILSHATGLVHLKSPSNPLAVFLPGKSWRHRRQSPLLDFRGLEALSHAAGSTLKTLTGQVLIRPSTPKPPTVLYAFTALRTLEWESSAQLKFKPNEVPVDALATLETLSCTSVNDTFLSLMCCMSLPALRHVAFPNASKMEGAHKFLQKHGSKIFTLKTENSKGLLALCPALTVLYLSGDSWFETHRTLTKIVIARVRSFKETTTKTDLKYLGQVGFRTRYPALQEIQVYCCTWPTTEREITKGPRANWVLWSEHLMTWNIKLTDETGKHWRPRLK